MKKFTLFGFKFSLDIKKTEENEEEKFSDSYLLKEKVFYLKNTISQIFWIIKFDKSYLEFKIPFC